jgi:hypothetical protein
LSWRTRSRPITPVACRSRSSTGNFEMPVEATRNMARRSNQRRARLDHAASVRRLPVVHASRGGPIRLTDGEGENRV